MKVVGGSRWQSGINTEILVKSRSDNVDIYPSFGSGNGKYVYMRNLYSPQLKNTRDIVLYLPNAYLENPLFMCTDVLIMHDGQNLFNRSTAFGGVAWMVQDTMDAMITRGELPPVCVIGVDNTDDRMNELTYSYDSSEHVGGKGDLYLDFIEQTVMPAVRSQYRIADSHQIKSMGIMGSSLGGLISCYAAATRPTVYTKAGCLSSSFWWNNQDFHRVIVPKYMTKDTPKTYCQSYYVDSGDSGAEDRYVSSSSSSSIAMIVGMRRRQSPVIW